MRRVRLILVSVLLAWGSQFSPARADHGASLSVDSPFIPIGSSANFHLSGHPGSSFALFFAAVPAEVPLGAAGTLFMAPGSFKSFAGGTLDATGSGQVTLPLPNQPGLIGVILYIQALVLTPGSPRFSNALPIRGQQGQPAGGRASRAIAVTPDGAKAFVAHQLDGAVSVIDAVNEVKLTELPVGPAARAIPHRPLDIAVDPEGRHAFVVNAAARFLTAIHVPTHSVAANIPVPTGSRRVAFDFTGSARHIYVTNENLQAVLVFEENPPGTFTALASLPLAGRDPGPLAVLPNRLLVVGHRATRDLELLNPFAAPGSTTLLRRSLGTLPLDIVVSGTELLVPTFLPAGAGGTNIVLRVNPATLTVSGSAFANLGTDYNDMTVAGGLTAVAATGSGAALVGDAANFQLLDRVDIANAGAVQPHGTPQGVAFVTGPTGGVNKLYVVDHFRETVRPVLLAGGPPYALGAEIPLAYSGAPRVPLSGALSPAEDGEYMARSVRFFNGHASLPNPVTCQTCHTDLVSDNFPRSRQTQPLFGLADTAPYNWMGAALSLLNLIRGAQVVHGQIGGPIPDNGDLLMLSFLNGHQPPASIYLQPDGTLSADAQAGKTLFEGAAQCASCHTAPIFIPAVPPLTIPEGVGTGLMPANVPSLRGVWATAPYFHDGSAVTLGEVFTAKPGDVHSTLTAGLTPQQIAQLVAYLRSL